jgi:hypothetical protein
MGLEFPMSPQAQLETFLDRYDPAIAALGRALIQKIATLAPGASINVYDNYNYLAVGFGATDRASDTIVSVALYPRWVRLFFMRGAELDDPEGLLEGKGPLIRSLVAKTAEHLDQSAVRALFDQAMATARSPINPAAPTRHVIKAVSEKQRPRRP